MSSVCATCSKAIEGGSNAVIALGQKHHQSCFVCPGCHKPFEKGFLDHKGRPYHEECLPKDATDVSTTCSACHGEIIGDSIMAAGRSFCADCFKCKGCNRKIGGGPGDDGAFDMFQGDFYHPHCVPKEALPTCAGCHQACHDQSVVIDGQFYHPSCAKCHKCFKPLSATPKYVQVEGHFYHFTEECCPSWQKPCPVCHKTLGNPAVEVDGKTMHSSCFVCSKCHKPFERTYVKVEDRYLHEECQ